MDYVLLFTCMEVFMYIAFIDENGNVLLTMIKLSPNTFCTIMFWPTFVDMFWKHKSLWIVVNWNTSLEYWCIIVWTGIYKQGKWFVSLFASNDPKMHLWMLHLPLFLLPFSDLAMNSLLSVWVPHLPHYIGVCSSWSDRKVCLHVPQTLKFLPKFNVALMATDSLTTEWVKVLTVTDTMKFEGHGEGDVTIWSNFDL